jgi:hypothetical protein
VRISRGWEDCQRIGESEHRVIGTSENKEVLERMSADKSRMERLPEDRGIGTSGDRDIGKQRSAGADECG